MNELDNIILPHIAIDLYMLPSSLNESNGVFEGLEEVTTKITNDLLSKIVKNIKSNHISDDVFLEYEDIEKHFPEFKYKFFLNLYISASPDKHFTGKYILNEELNYLKMCFDDVYITLTYDKQPILEYDKLKKSINLNIKKILMHELLHAFQWFNRMRKEYLRNGEFRDTSTDYQDVYKRIIEKSDDEARELVHNLLYTTIKREASALLLELATELKEFKSERRNINMIVSPRDALKYLKKTKYYNMLINMKAYLDLYVKGMMPKKIVDIFCDEYNLVFGKESTSEQIFRHIDKRMNDILFRLNRIIGKLCLENLNICRTIDSDDFNLEKVYEQVNNNFLKFL